MTPSPWPRRTSRRTPGSPALQLAPGPSAAAREAVGQTWSAEPLRALSSSCRALGGGAEASLSPAPPPPTRPGARPLRPADPPAACRLWSCDLRVRPVAARGCAPAAHLCARGFVPLLRLSAPLPGCRWLHGPGRQLCASPSRADPPRARHLRAPRGQMPRRCLRRGSGKRPKGKMGRLLRGGGDDGSHQGGPRIVRQTRCRSLLPPCACV